MKKIIRVFPERNNATPDDKDVRVGVGPGLTDEADEVHVSVAFTWDLPFAERLVKLWKPVAPVKIGGPATGMRGEEFTPGMYLKKGFTITSRGCPNKCWFCNVWEREGNLRELPIKDGWIVQDDNLLACSDAHIKKVFEMLDRQKPQPEFRGGLEASRLTLWHAQQLFSLKPSQMFFSYDLPEDLEPLREAGKLLHQVGFSKASHDLRCYVLCGYPGDGLSKAEKRMKETLDCGFTPMAMLWRTPSGCSVVSRDWKRFQREWARPAAIHSPKRKIPHGFL